MDENYGVVIPIASLPAQRLIEPPRLILETYTDAWIDQNTAGRDDEWAVSWRILRTVPVAWRQSVWACARAALTTQRGWMDVTDLNGAIRIATIMFHAGFRPERMEPRLCDLDDGLWRDIVQASGQWKGEDVTIPSGPEDQGPDSLSSADRPV